ncbi:MAG: hypothetical protein NC123_17270 [Butyrivibrio sp.]|nr:hypothetical protein [Butyrivibrio sp.]
MNGGEEIEMKRLLYKIKPPCAKCPYKLGAVTTPINPCPQCKHNGYDEYEQFLKLPWLGKIPGGRRNRNI